MENKDSFAKIKDELVQKMCEHISDPQFNIKGFTKKRISEILEPLANELLNDIRLQLDSIIVNKDKFKLTDEELDRIMVSIKNKIYENMVLKIKSAIANVLYSRNCSYETKEEIENIVKFNAKKSIDDIMKNILQEDILSDEEKRIVQKKFKEMFLNALDLTKNDFSIYLRETISKMLMEIVIPKADDATTEKKKIEYEFYDILMDNIDLEEKTKPEHVELHSSIDKDSLIEEMRNKIALFIKHDLFDEALKNVIKKKVENVISNAIEKYIETNEEYLEKEIQNSIEKALENTLGYRYSFGEKIEKIMTKAIKKKTDEVAGKIIKKKLKKAFESYKIEVKPNDPSEELCIDDSFDELLEK